MLGKDGMTRRRIIELARGAIASPIKGNQRIELIEIALDLAVNYILGRSRGREKMGLVESVTPLGEQVMQKVKSDLSEKGPSATQNPSNIKAISEVTGMPYNTVSTLANHIIRQYRLKHALNIVREQPDRTQNSLVRELTQRADCSRNTAVTLIKEASHYEDWMDDWLLEGDGPFNADRRAEYEKLVGPDPSTYPAGEFDINFDEEEYERIIALYWPDDEVDEWPQED